MLATPERVHERARTAISDPENDVLLSVASIWEAAIEFASGKLPLNSPPARLVEASLRDLAAEILPIEAAHAVTAASLPLHHRDPFDRALIAQSRCEQITLVSVDEAIRLYEVD